MASGGFVTKEGDFFCDLQKFRQQPSEEHVGDRFAMFPKCLPDNGEACIRCGMHRSRDGAPYEGRRVSGGGGGCMGVPRLFHELGRESHQPHFQSPGQLSGQSGVQKLVRSTLHRQRLDLLEQRLDTLAAEVIQDTSFADVVARLFTMSATSKAHSMIVSARLRIPGASPAKVFTPVTLFSCDCSR